MQKKIDYNYDYNILKLSTNEAYDRLHNDVYGPSHKDYWKIDEGDLKNFQHGDELQSIIDVLYNYENIKDRIYKVITIKQQSWNRLNIKCNVCAIDLSSYDPFISHNNGKQHKKLLMQSSSSEKKNPNIGHIVFKDFNEPCYIFESGSLEDSLDKTSHHVLGAHMLLCEEDGYEKAYTCRLCFSEKVSNRSCERMYQEEAFKHVLSDNHKICYLKRKYGLNQMHQCSSQEFHRTVRKYIDMEGRLSSPLTVLRNSDFRRRDCKPRPLFKQQHMDESPMLNVKKNKEDGFSQTDPDKKEGIQEFTQDLVKLQADLRNKKTSHPWVKWLISDNNIEHLVCLFVLAMCEKIFDYAQKHEPRFKDDAEKLVGKAKSLSLQEFS